MKRKKQRKAHVNVMGSASMNGGSDGRYRRQARENRRIQKDIERELELNPHTPAELRGYIENTYQVTELPVEDDRFKRAYMGVKAHLVLNEAPELLETPEMEMPAHPPVSDNDPDYVRFRENEEKRFQEAVRLPRDTFPMHLHVYNIPVERNGLSIAWIEVYVESVHEYLAFRRIDLEFEDHYTVDKIIADIVNYFSASKSDKRKKNERYQQLLGVQPLI